MAEDVSPRINRMGLEQQLRLGHQCGMIVQILSAKYPEKINNIGLMFTKTPMLPTFSKAITQLNW